MIPFIAAEFRVVAANKAARLGAAAAIALVLLWLARCDGERHQSARDRQAAADAQAKTNEHAAKRDAEVGDSVKAVLADSMRDLATRAARADSIAAHATASIGQITVIHTNTPAPRGETSVPGVDLGPEPDTTRYAEIQRQGDPRLYTVPQFVVDLGAELRRAVAAKSDEATKAEANLALATRVIAADSAAIRAYAAADVARAKAEHIAKSNAGQDCHLVPLVPCPSRKVVAVVAFGLGVVGGYEVAKR